MKTSRLILILALMIVTCGCRPERTAPGPSEKEEEGRRQEERRVAQRSRMVARLEKKGIRDEKVLDALRTVKRHRFVPSDGREYAYEGGSLAIGEGQTISSPYIVGLMTQILELEGGEKVLEIGTGSGYQAAILARMVPEVYTIEILPTLFESASRRLKELGYENVHVKCGDGFLGWPEEAPFDAIIVTAAPEEVPQVLVDQLREGGRLVIPLGPQGEHQKLYVLRKDAEGNLTRQAVKDVDIVPMIHGN